MIAKDGFAPSLEALATAAGISDAHVQASLERLHDAHALLLHPDRMRPWVVHPFSLYPSACWVKTTGRGYWATCLYCAFGIAAALDTDAVISTRIGGEAEAVRYTIKGGDLGETNDVFHLSTPPSRWWHNVIHACASFQPFNTESDANDWCARHALPKGAIMTMPQLWRFASDWYGGYLQEPWRRRMAADARALFERHGLTGAFWALPG